MNRVILVGRLGKDVELRYTQGGKAVAQFSLATSDAKNTDWHNIVAWEKTAEACKKFLAKGRQVAIDGRISYRTYEDKQGTKKYITEIVALHVEFLGDQKLGEQKQKDEPSGSDPLDGIPF